MRRKRLERAPNYSYSAGPKSSPDKLFQNDTEIRPNSVF